MDKREQSGRSSMKIEFLRTDSINRQAKVQEFWKYLESQDDLKPYEVPQIIAEKDKMNESSAPDNSSSDTSSAGARSSGAKPKPKHKTPKEKKRSNNTDICKLEKYFREDLRFADSVEVSYDELNAEIQDYQKRLLQCNCKIENCDCHKTKSKYII